MINCYQKERKEKLERERKQREEELAKQKQLEYERKVEEKKLYKQKLADSLPPEPNDDECETAQLSIRFPDGSRVIRSFRADDKLQVIYIFIYFSYNINYYYYYYHYFIK